jgi:nicotinate-nucleotide adenylyltransferase
MRIGICGGTFDPFHRGHLDPILSARPTLQWDRILYVPAFRQPFKADRVTASGPHRFAMTAIATMGDDALFISDVELERGKISYTVDTLEELRRAHAEDTLDWIIGDDNLAKLLEWKSIDRIFELANVAVLTRDGAESPPPALAARVTEPGRRSKYGAIVFAANPTVPVSSTEIRRRISAGLPVGDLVDARVSRYIHHHGLYRKGQS